MPVPVVNIREMRMFVDDGDVRVPVVVRGSILHWDIVPMLVVDVMGMAVSMGQWFVAVFMLMMFGQVQP